MWFINTASALDPNRATSQYVRDRWNSENGFTAGTVRAIAQTADGYLWLGTDKGLVRFDGLRFLTVRGSSPGTPPVTAVLGLTTDGDGDLWIHMPVMDLIRYHNQGFQNVRLDAGLPGITAMTRANDGRVLLSLLRNTPVRYNDGKFEPLAPGNLLPHSLVVSLAETPDGRVWLGTRDDGLFYLEKGRIVAVTEGLPDRKINSLLPTRDGRLLIGTDDGVALWNGSRISESELPASLRHVQVLTMLEDHERNIWIGTAHGVERWNAQGVSSLEGTKNGANAEITSLFEDREGNLWIGSAQGLERVRDSTFVTYSQSDGLPAESNGPIFVDAEERVWVAPSDGGLFWMKNGKVERVTNAGLAGDVIYSMAGGKGDLWIGRQRGGVTHLSPRGDGLAAETFTQAQGLAQNSVDAVHVSKDGTVWAGTLSGGVSMLRGGKFTTYTQADGLGSNSVAAIEESTDGTTWFATSGGLNALSNGHWRSYTERDGLPSEDVITLLEDSSGTLWIGTAGGLAFLKSNQIHDAGEARESLHEPIFGLAEDRNGSLWIATSSHVLRVNREKLLQGTVSDQDIHEFGLGDGLQGLRGVRRDRSVVKDEQGHIWFSMNRGLSVVDPARARDDSAPALAHIESLWDDGNPVKPQGAMHIPSSNQRIIIDYAGLNLSHPERVRFRYRLEGFDHDWSEPVATRQAIYTNLDPATYLFRVQASANDGVWNSPEATVRFRIEPALWQATWFQLSCVLALAVIVWLFFRLRMHQMTKELNVRFEERLSERMRIAQELHDTLLQGFLSASMQLHVAADHVPDSSPAKPLLTRVLQLMGQVTEEGRSALRGLRSSVRDTHSLEQTLSVIPQSLAIHDTIAYRVIVDGLPRPLHPVIRDEVYRIAREGLVNAFRHAQASSIEVEVEYAAKHLKMIVRDNGCGIDPQVLNSGREGHWGLPGMRERAERIGAKLRVWSGGAAGTEVELIVPNTVAYLAEPGNRLRSWLKELYPGKEKFEKFKGDQDK
jgi:ligand-binding sensor domain-containing protein/signal transduction histidine kinase